MYRVIMYRVILCAAVMVATVTAAAAGSGDDDPTLCVFISGLAGDDNTIGSCSASSRTIRTMPVPTSCAAWLTPAGAMPAAPFPT